MRYDLVLQAGRGKKLDKRSFTTFFKGRRHFEVGKGQAHYQNEDTGVYFIFDEPEDGAVMFNLNYYRPHVFGLEAAPELESFVHAFACEVGDPQGEMDDGIFSRAKFLKGWNHGNRFAYRSLLANQEEPEGEPVRTWPTKRIREVWEWNYARPGEDQLEEGMPFMPTIFAVAVDGADEPWSVAIWPPDCPILMPAVDGVLVPLAQSGKQSEELALVGWEEVSRVAKPYQVKGTGLPQYQLMFEQWPREVAQFLAKKRKPVGRMNGVGMDEVLDRELVEEARRRK